MAGSISLYGAAILTFFPTIEALYKKHTVPLGF